MRAHFKRNGNTRAELSLSTVVSTTCGEGAFELATLTASTPYSTRLSVMDRHCSKRISSELWRACSRIVTSESAFGTPLGLGCSVLRSESPAESAYPPAPHREQIRCVVTVVCSCASAGNETSRRSAMVNLASASDSLARLAAGVEPSTPLSDSLALPPSSPGPTTWCT